jgi:fusion and transport protein UGO1
MIDNKASPIVFSLAKFIASTVAIFVKLPIETVLRRGQVAVLKSRAYMQAIQPGERRLQSVVATGPYVGAFGTMYHIVAKEGQRQIVAPTSRPTTAGRGAKGKSKVSGAVFIPGQGLGGLWLGWRVSWWGLVGLWAAGVVGNGGEGEF